MGGRDRAFLSEDTEELKSAAVRRISDATRKTAHVKQINIKMNFVSPSFFFVFHWGLEVLSIVFLLLPRCFFIRVRNLRTAALLSSSVSSPREARALPPDPKFLL